MPRYFRTSLRWIAIMLTVAVAACGKSGELKISDAHINVPPAGAMMAAGFLKIDNQSKSDLILTGARVDGFGMTEIHETKMVDGMMRMRPRPGLDIASGETVIFAPGGLHLMLMKPDGELKAGQVIKGKLSFRTEAGTQKSVPISLDVRMPAGMAGPEHH